jgi:galactonate dehydratase
MAGEAAAARVAEGWTAVKFDPAGPYTIRGGHMPGRRDIGLSAAFCADIRAAVGDAADLLFGTHGQFIPGGAIRLAKAIEPSDPCGSRNRCRPTISPRWPRWRGPRRSPSRRASG